jgi:hypothetical protein
MAHPSPFLSRSGTDSPIFALHVGLFLTGSRHADPAVLYPIHVEETALHLAFGAEYEDHDRTKGG